MNLQENQAHFLERLYAELSFSPSTSAIQEIMDSINFSHPTHLIFKNVTSEETLEGSFFLEKNLLVHYQVNLKQRKILIRISGREFRASKDYIRPLICSFTCNFSLGSETRSLEDFTQQKPKFI